VISLPRLRFPDRALECVFLDEYAELDLRRYLSVWGIGIVGCSALRFANAGSPEELRVWIELEQWLAIPTMLAVCAFALAPRATFTRGWQWVELTGAILFQAVLGAAVLVVALRGHSPSARMLDFGTGLLALLIMIVYTAGALRLLYAVVATVVPALFYFVVAGTWAREAEDVLRAGWFLIAAQAFGVFACYQIERLRRAAFLRRQELAEERARTVGLLQREISHQVAARSKQLGDELARVESAAGVPSLQPGDRFARYRIIRALGAGGMGTVYEVERLTDEQKLALKIITGHVSGAVAARFAREAEIGARVHHSNLVSIVDVGVSPAGAPFLVMELVRGGSLEDWRPRFGDAAWVKPLLRQVADGLVALHDAGVVHRDLKPGNILLHGEDSQVAKISDFGISRFGDVAGSVDSDAVTVEASTPAAARLTGTGTLLGTPLYMAPESANGARAADGPCDVFAFGILAYEMLTGRPPFKIPPVLLALAKLPVPVPEPMQEVEALSRCLLECMAEDPAGRPTMRQVRRVLDAA
jgi:hypothetical protein